VTPRWLRRLFRVYPPYVGAGVRVTALADDFRFARVEMPLRWYNRNYVGTHFGGSLYSMVDPFFMIMVMRNLGPDYVVWDQSGSIEFVAPGRGTVCAEFRVSDADLDELRKATAGGGKALPEYEVEITALDGTVVARVRKRLYVRLKHRPDAPGVR
jgi:acyl-coenzyme A thioesterase PaaI-like protein